MSIMKRKPAPYHTAAGEAERLRAIIAMYSYDPLCVANATRTLNRHLEEHPEILMLYPSEGSVA